MLQGKYPHLINFGFLWSPHPPGVWPPAPPGDAGPAFLTPQGQSSERNLPVTIVQKLDIFYSGILNLEFLNFLFNF